MNEKLTVFSERVALLNGENNRDKVAKHILTQFSDMYEPNDNVYSDLVNFLADKTLGELLSMEVCVAYNHLYEAYIRKAFDSYVKSGKIDYDEYDRTKTDSVNIMTSLSIDFVNGLSINQLEVMSRNPRQVVEDFELQIEEDYPTLGEYKDFKAYIRFEIDGEDIENYAPKIERIFNRNGSKWKSHVNSTSMATNFDGKCQGGVKITVNGNSTFSKKSIEQAIRNRFGENAVKHPWKGCRITSIEVEEI